MVITPKPDVITISRAQFTRSTNEWRVEGSSDVFGPGVTVTVYNAAGTQIGTPQAVDALGAWKLRVTNSVGSSPSVTVKSTSGGTKTQASTIK